MRPGVQRPRHVPPPSGIPGPPELRRTAGLSGLRLPAPRTQAQVRGCGHPAVIPIDRSHRALPRHTSRLTLPAPAAASYGAGRRAWTPARSRRPSQGRAVQCPAGGPGRRRPRPGGARGVGAPRPTSCSPTGRRAPSTTRTPTTSPRPRLSGSGAAGGRRGQLSRREPGPGRGLPRCLCSAPVRLLAQAFGFGLPVGEGALGLEDSRADLLTCGVGDPGVHRVAATVGAVLGDGFQIARGLLVRLRPRLNRVREHTHDPPITRPAPNRAELDKSQTYARGSQRGGLRTRRIWDGDLGLVALSYVSH